MPGERFAIFLGNQPPQGSPVAMVEPEVFWRKYPLRRKVAALLTGNWWPSEEEKALEGEDTLLVDLFGELDDYGHDLLKVNCWTCVQTWDLSHLTERDASNATALEATSCALHREYKELRTSPPLNLYLSARAPELRGVIYAMAVKIPLLSVRFFVDVHARIAFNEVRRSNHPASADIVAGLYELLFLQQKTAVSLLRFLRATAESMNTKGDSCFMTKELEAIVFADAAVGQLKASVEKTLSMLGAVFGAKNLESKKSHKQRLEALQAAIPAGVLTTFYADLLMQMVHSDALKRLNDLRTGLLHKRGIADLQPHSYAGIPGINTPLLRVFSLLHEQHAMNSAAFVAALAMLTDDLVRRVPPSDPLRCQAELFELMQIVPRSRRSSGSSRSA